MIIIIAVPLIALEGTLRLFFGFPHGSFNFLLSAKDGLYPRNETIIMEYGFKPYTVVTNSYGMRGKEVQLQKTPGVKRIVTLGDSVTDGYFVANKETYPSYLEDILVSDGRKAEILSVARGGGSIDKELAMLKIIMPLKPDIVILVFVTNDIFEIMGKKRSDLLYMKFRGVPAQIPEWFLTKTAIGELIGDIKLRIKYKNYKLFKRGQKGGERESVLDRLGRRYDENVALFKKTTVVSDGKVLNEPFTCETENAILNYLAALDGMKSFCAANDTRLVLAYFPSYSQVYDPTVTMKMRDVLKEECGKLSIPFRDLTGAFRAVGNGKVLYFAPFDFHCNAEGNKLIASEIAELVKSYL